MKKRRREQSFVGLISWRDIPAQVIAVEGGSREKALLPARFQHAIDRAAVVAGMTDTKAYVSEWKQQKFELSGDPKTQMNELAGTIDAQYDEGLLERLVHNGGLDDGDASSCGL